MIDEERKQRAIKAFEDTFNEEPNYALFSPGRLEIIGNHTDHQGGHCIVGGCNLGIIGVINKRDDDLVRIISEGYEEFSFSLQNINQNDEEMFSSIGLTKGILKGSLDHGYKIGGFNAAMNSNIFRGAGVSSSAAFELFIAETINVLYNNSSMDRVDMAKIGQYSENVYFGKPSGLLDQTGSSLGGLVFVDFKDKINPVIEKLTLPEWKIHIVLVNTGGSHADLSDMYGEMPKDMMMVAEKSCKKHILSECDKEEVYKFVRNDIGNMSIDSKLRALHYIEEDERVVRAKKSISTSNLDWFLELEREAMLSQTYLLKNVMVPDEYRGSPLEAVDLSRQFLIDGVSRVMGGGLAGSTINFVPEHEFENFMRGMSKIYGKDNVVEVTIPEKGAFHEKL